MQKQQVWKAVIIDDEPNALIVMEMLLRTHCPNVQVVATLTRSAEAIDIIKAIHPDIVFLDIEMPQLNGFQLLEAVANERFHLIFTTAYDQYAVKAFRYSAIDYLLKPIVADELVAAINKVDIQDRTRQERVATLAENMNALKVQAEIIALPHARGYLFQAISEILFCEASNTYTIIHFENKHQLLVSKPLGEMESQLAGGPFFRVHRQYLVNTKKIKEFIRSDGGFIIMINGVELPLARNRKDDLMIFLGL